MTRMNQPGYMPPNASGQSPQMRVNMEKISNAGCVKCGHTDFTVKAKVKMISPIQSPSGEWTPAVMQNIVCEQCGHIFKIEEWVENQKKLANNPILSGRAD